MTTKKNIKIAEVVFRFDLYTLEAQAGEKRYSYFYTGDLKAGDVALVLVGDTPKGVLVTNTEPSAAAISRATKSIVGTVDLSEFRKTQASLKRAAMKDAKKRYTGAI